MAKRSLMQRAFRTAVRIARVYNQVEWDSDDSAKNGTFPAIPGREGYGTVSLGDGIESVPTAAACVRILRDSAAGLGRTVVDAGPYGKERPNHWGAKLLNMPNPAMTGTQFWRWVFGQIYARGEALVLIERNAAGEPVGLLPARISSSGYAPYVTTMTLSREAGTIWVTVPTGNGFSAGTSRVVPASPMDVLHLTDESYDPFAGRSKSPLECKARNPIGLYKMIVTRYLALLVNGGHADRYMNTDSEGYEAYLEAKKNRDAGVQNATDVLPIPLEGKIHEAGRSAIEMQTRELLTWLDPRICMAWGVPLFALGIEQQGGRGVRQDLREQYQQFLRSGFATQVQLVEEEINRKVFGAARGIKAKFELEDLTIGTLEQRASVVNILVQRTGVLTPNEGREIMGLAPLPGEDANQLRAATGAPAPQPGQSKAGSDGDSESDEGDGKQAASSAVAGLLGKRWQDADLSNPATLNELKHELESWNDGVGIH